MFTIYICSNCRNPVSLVYDRGQRRLCRSCLVAEGAPEFRREEVGRVERSTPFVRVVFPEGRIVEMEINTLGRVNVTDSSTGKIPIRKVRQPA